MDEPFRSFRSAFLPGFLVTLLFLVVGFVVVPWFNQGAAVNWQAVGVRLAVGMAIAAVLIYVTILLFPVSASPAGLRCYTFLGNYRTVPWAEIATLRPIHLIGLEYVRVGSSRGGLALWLPLFLSDMDGFRQAVRFLAGD